MRSICRGLQMSNRALLVIAFVLALALFGICPSARCDYAKGSSITEPPAEYYALIHEQVPGWIVEFVRELPHGKDNPELRLTANSDSYAAANVFLQAISDDGTYAFIRGDAEKELTFSRAIRYLRPGIVERMKSAWMSADLYERVKPVFWIDAIMRLYPHPENVDITRGDWEAAARFPLRKSLAKAIKDIQSGTLTGWYSKYAFQHTYSDYLKGILSSNASSEVYDRIHEAFQLIAFGTTAPLPFQQEYDSFSNSASWLAISSLSLFSRRYPYSNRADYAKYGIIPDARFNDYLTVTEYTRLYFAEQIQYDSDDWDSKQELVINELNSVLQLCSPVGDRAWIN